MSGGTADNAGHCRRLVVGGGIVDNTAVVGGGTADDTGNCCGWRHCRQHSSCGWRCCRQHRKLSWVEVLQTTQDTVHEAARRPPHTDTEISKSLLHQGGWCRPRDDHQTSRSHGMIQILITRPSSNDPHPKTPKPWCLPLSRINNLGLAVGHGSGDGHGSGRETPKSLSAPAPKRSLTCQSSEKVTESTARYVRTVCALCTPCPNGTGVLTDQV